LQHIKQLEWMVHSWYISKIKKKIKKKANKSLNLK
jgi:hypothetical protein